MDADFGRADEWISEETLAELRQAATAVPDSAEFAADVARLETSGETDPRIADSMRALLVEAASGYAEGVQLLPDQDQAAGFTIAMQGALLGYWAGRHLLGTSDQELRWSVPPSGSRSMLDTTHRFDIMDVGLMLPIDSELFDQWTLPFGSPNHEELLSLAAMTVDLGASLAALEHDYALGRQVQR